MDIEAYLKRIHYQGLLDPTSDTLRALHRAYMYSVPFENLDIPLGRRIVLDEAYLYDKIVKHRRGGFCYELNGLFSALLREMGFQVQRLSARVANREGGFGMEFDHMTLLVQLEERWLADVGFGDSFHEPLRLDEHGSQVQEQGTYRISDEGSHLALLRKEDSLWKAQYIFTLQPHKLSDFSEACLFHQTSPESHFTQGSVCSRATPEGRITLRNMRLIITSNGRRTEQVLEGEASYQGMLREQFRIVL